MNKNQKKFVYQNISITSTGHSGFLIQSPEIIIYIDPFKVPNNLPKADLILITHEHFDHLDPESINKIIQPQTTIIAPETAASKLNFPNLKILNLNNQIATNNVIIKTIPAYNINKTYHPEGEPRNAYIITINSINIFHAGDTDFIPEMSSLGPIDIALLPIGGTYTMTVEEAAQACKMIKPRIVIPMHYGPPGNLKADPELFKKLVSDNSQVEILI